MFSLLGPSFSIVLPGVTVWDFVWGGWGLTQCPLLEGKLVSITFCSECFVDVEQKIYIYICETQTDSLHGSFLDLSGETPPPAAGSRWLNFWQHNFYIQVLIEYKLSVKHFSTDCDPQRMGKLLDHIKVKEVK